MLNWQKSVIIFFVAVVLFSADKAGFFSSVSSAVRRLVVGPITRTVFFLGEESVFLFKNVFYVRGLIRENLFLKNQRDFFRGEYFSLLELKAENEFLKNALNVESAGSESLVLAKVLSFDAVQANDFFIVNKGFRDGIQKENSVILSGNILVGKVIDVLEKESRVMLITSAQSRVTTSSEDNKAKGVVVGSASGVLNLDLVLKDDELISGQILLSSGLDGVFKPGFLVGEVGKITNEDSAPFKKSSVRPFFTLRDLKQVFVLLK